MISILQLTFLFIKFLVSLQLRAVKLVHIAYTKACVSGFMLNPSRALNLIWYSQFDILSFKTNINFRLHKKLDTPLPLEFYLPF